MRNKIFIILVSILIISTFNSCEKELEIDPNSALIATTAFKTVNDLQNALNSAYRDYNNETIAFNSIFTDNTKVGKDNGGQELTRHRLVMDPSSGTPLNIWVSRYSIINKVNRIIEASELIDKTGHEKEVNHILGQCYALRAFAHFELYQYFTPDYEDENGVSVPAVDFIVTVENLPRNTVGEVFTLIENDLTKASELLDSSKTDNKYVTNDFITALKARMYLFKGDYVKAKDNAQTLIKKYELANPVQYRNMYLDFDETEVIFKSARVVGDAAPGYIWHFSGGGPFIEMSNSLYNILDPSDIRYEVLFNVAESDPSTNYHLINKYPGTSNEFLADFKVFRVSEMFLIKAEVQIRDNQLKDAKNTIKLLRDKRFGTSTDLPSFNSVNSGLDYLLQERRIELAYEGHRYLDLKRLKRDLIRDDLDCGNLENACELLSSDRRFTLPIPLSEMNANDLMEQNPGY